MRQSVSAETNNQESPRRTFAWAPIPKIAPPQSLQPSKSEQTSTKQPEPTIEITPASSKAPTPEPNQKIAEADAKSVANEKKPALPATASWGKGVANSHNHSSQDTITTPVNFGPSLSDAVSTPQKPKQSPTIPRKKEKKLKSKMVRLEDFEEGKTGKPQGVNKATKAKKEKQNEAKEGAALSDKSNMQHVDETQQAAQVEQSTVVQSHGEEKKEQQPTIPEANEANVTDTHATEAQPIEQSSAETQQVQLQSAEAGTMDIDGEKEAGAEHLDQKQTENQENNENALTSTGDQVETTVQSTDAMIDDGKQESNNASLASKETEDHPQSQDYAAKSEEQCLHGLEEPTAKPDDVDEPPHEKPDSKEISEELAPSQVVTEGKTAFDDTTKSPRASKEPSFANYVLGDLVMDDADDITGDVSDEEEGGLSSLKADLSTDQDVIYYYDRNENQRELSGTEQSEKVEEERTSSSSPFVAMERFSAVVDHQLVSGSPEKAVDDIGRQSSQPGMPPFFDLRSPPDNTTSRANVPRLPPGLAGPAEWQALGFDPFNGQDPRLITSRRLQHSQQMLEALGLYPCFHGPMVNFSPDFHTSGTPPPPPPQAHAPSAPMFDDAPPPQGMGSIAPNSEFRGAPPGLNSMVHNPEMFNLEQRFQNMNMKVHHEGLDMSREQEQSVKSMQDSFRALLPNVNISFSPLPEEHINHIARGHNQFTSKPHTPGADDRRLSEHARIPTEHADSNRRMSSDVDAGATVHRSSQQIPSFGSNDNLAHEKEFLEGFARTAVNGYHPVLFPAHKPDALSEVSKAEDNINQSYTERRAMDAKQEAQDFFDKFLRKAAAPSSSGDHVSQIMDDDARSKLSYITWSTIQDRSDLFYVETMPFQDPAIMSVRMGDPKSNASRTSEATESLNSILHVLSGRQQPHEQMDRPPTFQSMNEAKILSPSERGFGGDMAPKPFEIFNGGPMSYHQPPPPPHHPHPHQHSLAPPPPPPHPMLLQQHHQQQPPPPFMSGFGQPPMGMMPRFPPPPPQHPPVHEPVPPPGMIPPPHHHHHLHGPMEMGFGLPNGNMSANFPPGLFPLGGRLSSGDGM